MALIVEDGSIVVRANCYVTGAEADAYWADRHNADWAAASVPDKEAALIAGAAYVDNSQMYQYSGSKQTAAQWMDWPRSGSAYWHGGPTIPNGIIPNEIKLANMEAAFLSLTGNLPVTGTTGAGAREVKKEKVDAIEVEYFHSLENRATGGGETSPIGLDAISRYGHPIITGIVAPLLREDTLVAQTGTGVPRAQAARRGVRYLPSSTPAAFKRAQFDHSPFHEEKTRDGS